jgi:hypothetical protein
LRSTPLKTFQVACAVTVRITITLAFTKRKDRAWAPIVASLGQETRNKDGTIVRTPHRTQAIGYGSITSLKTNQVAFTFGIGITISVVQRVAAKGEYERIPHFVAGRQFNDGFVVTYPSHSPRGNGPFPLFPRYLMKEGPS